MSVTKTLFDTMPDGAPVHFKNLIGKPVFTIPLLGYVAHFIQHPPGMYIAIAIGAVLLILVFLPDLLKKNDGKSKEAKEAKEPEEPKKSDESVEPKTETESKPEPKPEREEE